MKLLSDAGKSVKKLALTVGQEPVALGVRVAPDDALDRGVTVSSSNEAVVTVALQDGKLVVTPVAPGKATVVVTAQDGSKKTAKLSVTVK